MIFGMLLMIKSICKFGYSDQLTVKVVLQIMSKVTDRILWTVLILALGVSLFLIFSPFSKTMMDTVHDKLAFTGASQVSDLPVAPQIQIENDHVVKQNLVGDSLQIADFNKVYIPEFRHNDSNQQQCVTTNLWPRNINTLYYRLVPNKPHGQMYLSVTADYDVKNITSMHDDLTAGLGGNWHSMVAEVAIDDGQGSQPIHQAVKLFSDADIGTSPHGTMHRQWKLPVSADNAKLSRISIYVANLKADKITLNNVKIGLWGGSVKLVTGDNYS